MRSVPLLILGLPLVSSTDWCEMSRVHPNFFEYSNLSTLLSGQTLRVLAFHEPPWSTIDMSLPEGVGEGYRISGFEPELMLAIAEQGQFLVEYHARIVGPNETWTQALVAEKENYDLIAGGGWMDTALRRNRGVTFTSSINNHGIVLAMQSPKPKPPEFWENAFFFFKPFTGPAYAMAACMAIIPGFLIWVLERKRQQGLQGVLESQYMGALAIMGWGDFTWAQSWFARAIMANWALMCLILLSSYTASLTNFLITSDEPKLAATSASDFLSKGFTACIPQGYGAVAVMKTKWGGQYGSQLVEVPPPDLSKEVFEGTICTGMMLQQDYLRIILRGGAPKTDPLPGLEDYGCTAELVGATEITGVGAFPAGNSNCQWFVIQIIDTIIRLLGENLATETLYNHAVNHATKDPDGKPLCKKKTKPEPAVVQLGPDHLFGLVLVTIPAIVFITIFETILRKVMGTEIGLDTTSLDVHMQEFEERFGEGLSGDSSESHGSGEQRRSPRPAF